MFVSVTRGIFVLCHHVIVNLFVRKPELNGANLPNFDLNSCHFCPSFFCPPTVHTNGSSEFWHYDYFINQELLFIILLLRAFSFLNNFRFSRKTCCLELELELILTGLTGLWSLAPSSLVPQIPARP
jgi:hypothetical protein